MSDNIWDVILSKTEEAPTIVKTYKLEDPDSPQKELFFTPHEKFGDEKMSKVFDHMRTNQNTAKELVQLSILVLYHFPSFDLGEASCMSQHMLRYENTDIDDINMLLDILIPNLYCTLLLDAHRKEALTNEPSSLTSLIKQYELSLNLDFTALSRNLSKGFSEMLQELFLVSPKAGNREYKIRTPYPGLFLRILNNYPTSPLSNNPKTAFSLARNQSFFENCMEEMLQKQTWTVRDFEQYYLFERFFSFKY